MTPLALEILLWYSLHAAEAGPFENYHLQPQQDVIKWFLSADILRHEEADPPNFYRPTERGRAFLALILSTPLPKASWVDPRNDQAIANWP